MILYFLIAGVLLGTATGLGGSVPDEEGIRKAILHAFTLIVMTFIGGGIYLYNPLQLGMLSQFLISFAGSFIITLLIGLRYRKWKHGVPVVVWDS